MSIGGRRQQPSHGRFVSRAATLVTGASGGASVLGTSAAAPALAGSLLNTPSLPGAVPRRRLGDLVTAPDSLTQDRQFLKPGASTIFREQGQRFIAIKFGVRGRDLASTVAEAQAKIKPLMPAGYRTEWSGEFEGMQRAERRLAKVFAVSLAIILVLLYMAFGSVLDAAVVFANVIAMGLGGVWALKLAGLNFNISAAVGFISILGVAVMNGMLFVSAYNRLRVEGNDLKTSIFAGTGQVIRPVTDRSGRDPRPAARGLPDKIGSHRSNPRHRRGRRHVGDALASSTLCRCYSFTAAGALERAGSIVGH